MNRAHMSKFKIYPVVLCGALLMGPLLMGQSAYGADAGDSSSSAAASTAPSIKKATDWIGRVVITPDGELLGRIEDLAVDMEAKQLKYVVVSVGSFLIDRNLIAVDPDALGQSEDGRYLVVNSDVLETAYRFGASSWPSVADVLPSNPRVRASLPSPGEDQDDDVARDPGVVATISDGRRTATMKAGENKATIETDNTVPAPRDSYPEVAPKKWEGSRPLLADSAFERLDDNGDGYLSRREIGPRLDPSTRYKDYDLDGNDGIDAFEFQAMKTNPDR